jgi:lysyl-tRNA synthetase class 2
VSPRDSDAGAGAAWRPSASLRALQARAALFARIRAFFAERGVLEVETPMLSRYAATDPALESFRLGDGLAARYLHTSPEFPMKRLLAAGSGPIYQICRVFRDRERGRRHHPEFTLLEWYRPGFTMQALMDEVADLLRVALNAPDLAAERIAYRELFVSRLGLDPWHASVDERRAAALAAGVPGADALMLDADGWLDLLLCHCLEGDLGRGRMTFLYDYPPSQAALARVRATPYPAAERFELYLEGVELANGFRELTDAPEQRRRFEADLLARRRHGQRPVPLDAMLLAALEAGMPDSAGVALGLDRLLMGLLGVADIDGVLAFPAERA